MCWVREEEGQDKGSTCGKGDVNMDQLASNVFLVTGCWMLLEQVVGQVNSAFNSGTSCRMSACCCSLPGEKCQYNVSGSDSVHNTSAVILLCNNVTFIFGK